MTRATDHVLDAIDGALADWDTSVDAMRWTPDPDPLLVQVAPGLYLVPHPITDEEWARLAEAVRPAIQRATEQLSRMITEQIRPAVERAAQGMNRFAQRLQESGFLEQIQAAGVVEIPAPVDPRERALHARRTRSTGPAQRPGPPPRRIDARRSA